MIKDNVNRFAEWLKIWSARSEADWAQEFIRAKVQVLRQSIKDAFRFLRDTHIKSPFYRHKLPWYLVFGAENTGKTSLLAMSGLGLVSTDNQPVQHVSPTLHCHWFFGKEAVFVDVSGALMVSEAVEDHSLHVWKKFVALLYRHRHFRPVDGLIVCVDLLDFQRKDVEQRRLHIEILRHHIQAFKHTLPVHLMFTRCDRMRGFTDFFQMLTAEERQQACGVSLPSIDQQNFSQQLEVQLNTFLQRINQQIIVRLQRERNPEKRTLIKNFPLQLEAQKTTIIQLVSQLHSTNHSIQGIYFTSSQQEGIQSDALATLSDTFGFPQLPALPDRPLQKNAYFVQNALQRIIQTKHTIERNIPLATLWQSRRFYPLLAGIFLLAILIMLPGYFANKRAITDVETLISNYQNTALSSNQQDNLSLLNTLRNGLDDLDHISNPLTNLVFHRASHLKDQLNTLYQEALVTQFIPTLQQHLVTQLQDAVDNKSPALFDTLKVYLMLGNPQHLDRHTVNAWFAHYVQQAFPDNTENQRLFLLHVNAMLDRSLAFNTDAQVINSARDSLNNLAPEELAYNLLQNDYATSPSNKNAANTMNNPLYNAASMTTVLDKDIPAMVSRLTQADAWVLDTHSSTDLAATVNKQLITDIQQLYRERYLAFWEAQLTQINVPAFTDMQAARDFTDTLGTSHSALLQPLNTIQANLQPLTTQPEAEKVLAALDQTRQLLSHPLVNDDIGKSLTDFKSYLDKMLSTTDNNKAILAAAQDRMRANGKDAIDQLLASAKTAPAPLDRWLTTLALNIWSTMLQTSQQQLNVLWSTNVLPKYNTTILNRYPIFKDAKTDISLADFSHFFGPGGIMEDFFKHDLAPFVDTSSLYWRWKTLDGLQLTIPQATLEMFNRAYVIRKMYFADNQKMPQFKFSVTPTSMELMSDNIALNIAGQTLNYATDFQQAKKFTWPDAKPTTASLEDNQETSPIIAWKETGDWALFKLFAHAELASSVNPRLYQFEFVVNGKQVVYELLADNAFNPFIPDIATQFRCVDRL